MDEDSISNCSGDTWLLHDIDENSSEIDIYAARASRALRDEPAGNTVSTENNSNTAILEQTASSRISRRNTFIQTILPLTTRVPYTFLRIILDSKVVFDALADQNFPPNSIRCLQRRPAGGMLTTFATPALKERFVSNIALPYQNRNYAINDDGRPLVYLNIYGSPYELPDTAIINKLQPFCEVVSTRRGKFTTQPDVFNGMRHYRVRIIKAISSYLRFGKFLVRLSHDGQQHTCRKCNRAGHFANECENTVCFNCEE